MYNIYYIYIQYIYTVYIILVSRNALIHIKENRHLARSIPGTSVPHDGAFASLSVGVPFKPVRHCTHLSLYVSITIYRCINTSKTFKAGFI